MFFLLYRHTDDGVIDDFPKISDHFPKISDHFPKISDHFPKISDHFPKISEDSLKFVRNSHERCRAFSKNFRRLPKIAKEFRGRLEDVSIIFKRQT